MELSERLSQAVAAVGILASALPDALSRGERHFTAPPTDAELVDWAASLKTSAPHFFPQATPPPALPTHNTLGIHQAVWDGMSPDSHYQLARQKLGYNPESKQRSSLVSEADAAAHEKISVQEFNALPPLERRRIADAVLAQRRQAAQSQG